MFLRPKNAILNIYNKGTGKKIAKLQLYSEPPNAGKTGAGVPQH